MRKVIGSINMTLDGFCDHTAVDPDEEIHQYYADLLNEAGVLLYGRITYELMLFWPTLIQNPSGQKSMDDFAKAIDQVPKIVFSNTLKQTGWESATLAKRDLKAEVSALKQQSGKDIYVGSRGLIIQLLNLQLMDELRLCIHPVLVGKGLPLFEHIQQRTTLTLLKTRTFQSGAIVHSYQPAQLSEPK